ncbi:unnamed protein product [Albugo candida]|uniref:Uncharacterized protein n=1 Tax=Albugo candida TaxID=65357 RepID=A0A024GAW3_9STRA|nr:unnamed protein product [Albugo candida]|eukprot:CCI44001.1 unnamed protein product [Albugo candida]
MGKCLSKSKCKLVFKWKQQRAHRATCRRKFPLASFFATQQWQSNYTKRHCF